MIRSISNTGTFSLPLTGRILQPPVSASSTPTSSRDRLKLNAFPGRLNPPIHLIPPDELLRHRFPNVPRPMVVLTRHLHTRDHQKPTNVIAIGKVQERYASTDFVGIEDHGGFFNPGSVKTATVGPSVIPGAESSVKIEFTHNHKLIPSHAGMLGVSKEEQQRFNIHSGERSSVAQPKIHQADGVLIMNHPGYPYVKGSDKLSDFVLSDEDAASFDAVEVFNDGHFRGNKPTEILAWFQANFYDRGLFPAIISGQDDHANTAVTKSPTYTLLPGINHTESSVMAAIRAGRTYISKKQDVQLEFNLDQAFQLGQKAILTRNSPHQVYIALNHLKPNSRIQLIYNGNILSDSVSGSSTYQHNVDISAIPGADGKNGYLYLKVLDSKDKTYLVTSALHFLVV